MLFRWSNNANRMKARDWWKKRSSFRAKLRTTEDRAMTVSSRRCAGVSLRKFYVKALSSRGRKRAAWVDFLHSVLQAECEHLRTEGVKLRKALLQQMALQTFDDPAPPFPGTEVNERTGKPIRDLITYHWVYGCMSRSNIIIRKKSGSLSRCPSHSAYTEILIAYYLGQLQRDFISGGLDGHMVENMDETHFLMHKDNHRTLEHVGEGNVSYADVASGGEDMTMVLRISGGVNAKLQPSFMVFKNRNRNYPIYGVPDNVPGVSYRTGQRACMDHVVFDQWLNEPPAVDKDSCGRTTVLFINKCTGHNETPAVLQSLQTINEKNSEAPQK